MRKSPNLLRKRGKHPISRKDQGTAQDLKPIPFVCDPKPPTAIKPKSAKPVDKEKPNHLHHL